MCAAVFLLTALKSDCVESRSYLVRLLQQKWFFTHKAASEFAEWSTRLTAIASVLCDIIEDSVAGLLVLQPLANEDTGGGGVELATAQHAVTVSHAVLEGSVVNLTAGVPADRRRRVNLFLQTTNQQLCVLPHSSLLFYTKSSFFHSNLWMSTEVFSYIWCGI